MPWIEFTEDFDWKPKPQVTIAYRAGMALNVTTACANDAVRKGKGKRLKRGFHAGRDACESED